MGWSPWNGGGPKNLSEPKRSLPVGIQSRFQWIWRWVSCWPHEFDEEMPVPEQISSKSYVDSPPMLSKKKTVLNSLENVNSKQNHAAASAEFVEMSNEDVKIFINDQENKKTLSVKLLAIHRKLWNFFSKRVNREKYSISHMMNLIHC